MVDDFKKRPFFCEMTLKAYCLFESHWIPGVGNDRGSTYVCGLIFAPPPTLHTNPPPHPQLLSGGSSARLGSHQCHQSIRAHGLGALQWEAQSSTPHQLSQHAEGPGHTEQHSVVIHLGHSVVLHRRGKQRRACQDLNWLPFVANLGLKERLHNILFLHQHRNVHMYNSNVTGRVMSSEANKLQHILLQLCFLLETNLQEKSV